MAAFAKNLAAAVTAAAKTLTSCQRSAGVVPLGLIAINAKHKKSNS
jgi:hypothetical protein